MTDESSPGSGFWKGRGISNAVSENMSIFEGDDEIIYASYLDLGLWRSLDEGFTWQEINEPAYSGGWSGKGGNIETVLADPVRSNVVWAGLGETVRSEE